MSRWRQIYRVPAGLAVAAASSAARSVRAFIALFDFGDVLLFAGAGLLGHGLFQIYQPLGFIGPGLIFVFVAIRGIQPAGED